MNILTEKVFFIDFSRLTRLYPSEITGAVADYGVLSQYKDQKYTLTEVNQIIADLIVKQPYIPNAMHINVNVMYLDEQNALNYHQSICFKNHTFRGQERTTNTISFLSEQMVYNGSL